MGCTTSRQGLHGSAGEEARASRAERQPSSIREVASKRISKGPMWKYGNEVTQQQLVDMRREFFATRVEGNAYIWQVIRAAGEALLENDEDLCNSIMDASAVVCPSGLMTICFDDSGSEYRVPRYCFSNPEDMRSTLDEARGLDGIKQVKLEPGELVILKIQVAPIERKFELPATSNTSIMALKQLLYAHVQKMDDGSEKPVGLTPYNQRIIYCGKELSDTKTVVESGVSPDFVLQVYLRKKG